mgnify:CR=1 FL=1
MTREDIFKTVDHTLLAQTATWEEIKEICDDAIKYQTASVCIPASYVKRAKDYVDGKMAICTVIGFPLGYNCRESKIFEARQALAHGADELDMVIDLGAVHEGRWADVAEEISSIKQVSAVHVLKVIIETCYLSEAEKRTICQLFPATGADFLKTSTGFGSAGAQLEDIRLFRSLLPPQVKLKAAGGIRTREEMEAFLLAGCDRLGCSAGVKALYGEEE